MTSALLAIGIPVLLGAVLGLFIGALRMFWLLLFSAAAHALVVVYLLDAQPWPTVLLAAVIALLVLPIIVKITRHFARSADQQAEEPPQPYPGEEPPRRRRPSRWPRRLNRLAGAGLGAVMAWVWLLVMSTAVIAATHAMQSIAGSEADPPGSQRMAKASEVSESVIRLSHEHVLAHIPGARDISAELIAGIELLEEDDVTRRWLLEQRDYTALIERPVFVEARNDEEYRAILVRIRDGEPGAVKELRDHPRTKAIVDDPAVRDFVLSLRPSILLAELRARPQAEPGADGDTASLNAPTEQP
jgi:hypothetical protein